MLTDGRSGESRLEWALPPLKNCPLRHSLTFTHQLFGGYISTPLVTHPVTPFGARGWDLHRARCLESLAGHDDKIGTDHVFAFPASISLVFCHFLFAKARCLRSNWYVFLSSRARGGVLHRARCLEIPAESPCSIMEEGKYIVLGLYPELIAGFPIWTRG